MTDARYLTPIEVLPSGIAEAVDPLAFWFVIGGQAVRCLAPYRPSQDVDFGVGDADGIRELIAQLTTTGEVEVLERSIDTVHLTWNGIKVSLFILAPLQPFTEDRRLSVVGILATKMHAILERGTRRDFFDLYVTLQSERLGLTAALSAIREVYGQPIKDALLLRAVTYFEDAERELPLAAEGRRDWETVKAFFMARAADLLLPPAVPLEIQRQRVDVRPLASHGAKTQ